MVVDMVAGSPVVAWVFPVGFRISGGVVSDGRAVTFVWRVSVLVFPAVSVTVRVTVYVPSVL